MSEFSFRKDEQLGDRNIAFIDSLRGVAILLVIFHHVGEIFPDAQLIRLFSPYGKYGVQLFFVLSAFTMCYTAKGSQLSKSKAFSFYIKRLFRIAPLYLLFIPFYFLLSYLSLNIFPGISITKFSGYTLINVLSNILFVHGIYPPGNNTIVPGGWSIGCEMIFYLLFPFLFYLFNRSLKYIIHTQIISWLILFVILLLARLSGHKGLGGGTSFAYYFIANQMSPFLIGILVFFLWSNVRFTVACYSMAIISIVAFPFLEVATWGWIITPACAGLVSIMLIKLFVKIRKGNVFGKIGHLSFSIYLSHFFFIWVASRTLVHLNIDSNVEALLSLFLIVFLSFVFSIPLYNFIELPFIKYGRQLSYRVSNSTI